MRRWLKENSRYKVHYAEKREVDGVNQYEICFMAEKKDSTFCLITFYFANEKTLMLATLNMKSISLLRYQEQKELEQGLDLFKEIAFKKQYQLLLHDIHYEEFLS